MQSPVGFELSASGKVVDVQPIQAMLNPSTPVMTTHMILAGYMATGLTVASVYAVGMLKGRADLLPPACARGRADVRAGARARAGVRGRSGREARGRAAADEARGAGGLWDTTANAPLTIGGIPLPGREETILGIRIPGALSWLAFGDTGAVVQGLKEVPPEDRPNTILVHLAFQAMVAIGFAFLGPRSVGAARDGGDAAVGRCPTAAGSCARPPSQARRVHRARGGWIVTEVGRQPWIVYGQMRTADAVTTRGGIVWWLARDRGHVRPAGRRVLVAADPAGGQATRRGAVRGSRGARRGDDMSATALEVTALLAIGVGLTLYVLLGGADFGGGVWDLLAHGSERDRERSLISSAIGPGLGSEPRLADLRGHGPVRGVPARVRGPQHRAVRAVRHRDRGHRDARCRVRVPGVRRARYRMAARLDAVFGIASLVTPFVLGMCAAAIASGRIRISDGARPRGPAGRVDRAPVVGRRVPLARDVRVPRRDLPDRGGRATRRSRARTTLPAAGVGRRPDGRRPAGIGLLVIRADARILWDGMVEDGWPFIVSSAVAGAVALGATYRGKEQVARAGAAIAVASVIAGWGVAQWPYLIVPDLTAAEAAAPKSSLGPIVIGLVVGAALVAPSLFLLFRVFKASQGPSTATPQGSGESSTSV
jgi:cytochrome bd-type quinol oxidase subunit 1